MRFFFSRFGALILVSMGLILIFVVRALAAGQTALRSNDVFTILIVAASLAILGKYGSLLHPTDWAIAIGLGLIIGVEMAFASLFTPYPFAGLNLGLWRAPLRGLGSAAAALGGLVIMRKGGPVLLHGAYGNWRKVWSGVGMGLLVGLPLAILNVLALQMTQERPIVWQNLFVAIFDAIQPSFVEEVVYRFALLGVIWLALCKSLPKSAGWLAGVLALLVHNYIHFDDLFLQAPLMALGMGLVISIVWGLPLTYLALRKNLEAAIAFHWLQDAVRFWVGF